MKTKLFTCYCSNVYLCSLWVKFRKSSMHHFIVSYNNAFRILHGLPMRCSASGMFASSGVNSCQTLIRRCVYSLQCRLHASLYSIVDSIINCEVHLPHHCTKHGYVPCTATPCVCKCTPYSGFSFKTNILNITL